ncbi:MAG TPA: VWA domain-containing protein [Sediminispirochaeta sp.]|nr:VWA domain-containing protein [Sediminispirochaeta sp.]
MVLFSIPPSTIAAQEELELSPDDLEIEQSLEGGYHLYIRAKEGIGSVLLTESTADPEKQRASYALRNPEYHPVNGEERRMLDGEFLDAPERGHFFLVDSTPEPHPDFGKAFHIFIPYVVEYGYPWTREGELQVLDGTWLNIRTFAQAYANYEGPFRDNPFMMELVQIPSEPREVPEENYMDDTRRSYQDIADNNSGELIYGRGGEDIINNVREVIRKTDGKSIDLVLCLDTTKSMEDDIPHLRDSLVPMLQEEVRGFEAYRIGILLYRDYYEAYLAMPYDFQSDFGKVQAILNRIRVFGGRDIPEAIYEALYRALEFYPWKSEKRLIILVGDAPPHPRPRGKITREMVFEKAGDLGVEIHPIILPH